MILPPNFQEFDFLTAGFCNAKESLDLAYPILMNQVHGTDVLVLTESPKEAPSVDALVTTTPHLKLTIKTADCAPVLFVAPEKRIIAAAHAGWKGAYQGILESTLLQMIQLGANVDQIRVAIGPHLTKKNFQISADMQKLFPQTEQQFFTQTDSGSSFDFSTYLKHRLIRAGVQDIFISSIDTFEDSSYNSYRRDPKNLARQYSFIELT